MTMMQARDLQADHLGLAVRIPHVHPFVLHQYSMLLWEPNRWTDAGHVHMRDRLGRFHTANPDDLIEVEGDS